MAGPASGGEFEHDVRARFGTQYLREDVTFAYDLARRPY
jgi:hypothetical protein